MRRTTYAALALLLLVALFGTALAVGENGTQNVTEELPTDESASAETLVEAPAPEEAGTELRIPEEPVALPVDVQEVISEHEEKFTEYTLDVLKEKEPEDEVRLLIRYKDGFDEDMLDGFSSKESLSEEQVAAFTADLRELDAIISSPLVELIEVNQDVEILDDIVPYGVNYTLAPTAWIETTGEGVKVGIVDSGIAAHSDLSIAGGASMVGGGYEDTYGHGTAVAGVVAALADDVGLVGVAPSVDLYSIKVMNGGSGQLSDVLAGIEWARENDIDILVMSFGIEGYSQLLKEALEDAYDNGILLVAASGNDGVDEIVYPAAYTVVIAVGATDKNNELASFSNYGFEQELVAAGVEVNTTGLSGGYDVQSGTSMAAPHVAGIAALLLAHNASWTNTDVRGKLQNDALDLGATGWDDLYGYGLVRAELGPANTTQGNASYFYEVYNITHFGTPEEFSTFWLNGTGSIDDVNFKEGHYIVTKYLPDPRNVTMYVNENGTVQALVIVQASADDYTLYGGNDGKVWEGGAINFTCSSCSSAIVNCYEYDSGGSFDFNGSVECWAEDNLDLGFCRAADPSGLDAYCTSNPSKCHDTGVSDAHPYPSANLASAHREFISLRSYTGCGAGYNSTDDEASFYVMEELNTSCTTASDWSISGYHGTGGLPWTELKESACGTGKACDSVVAGFATTNKTYDFVSAANGTNYPCRIAAGFACNATDTNHSNNCLAGHTCSNGICIPPNSTDMRVTEIVPIQVVSNVPMIKDKEGYVLVNITNQGNMSGQANVDAWFNSAPLTISSDAFAFTNSNPRNITAGASALFIFDFNPSTAGTNLIINASVEVS